MSSNFDELFSKVKQKHSQTESQGSSFDELFSKVKEKHQEPSFMEQAGRTAGQFALGAVQGSPLGLAYDVAVSPFQSKDITNVMYRGQIAEDLEELGFKKYTAGLTPEEEERYLDLEAQLKDHEVSGQYAQPIDISLQTLAEKATGVDLSPKGVAEKAARWTGFVKDPRKLMELGKSGLSLKNVTNAIAPSGKELLRGLGAGTALTIAEDGDYGPIGTLAAAVIGDIAGSGAAGALKGVAKFAKEPKKTLAEVTAKFTKKDKLNLQKEIVDDFRKAGIKADAGTITDSNLIKWVQSRLSQSGLTGKALDEFKDGVIQDVKKEYKKLADSLGEARFNTNYEAGQVVKETLNKTREADLGATRQLYENARTSLSDKAAVDSSKIVESINRLQKELKPGQLKSAEQNIVLEKLEALKRDVTDSEGRMIWANVKDLMNNKIALNDAINYEVQGGAKQLLKGVVADLDRAIISHGKENPRFAKNYVQANKRFSQHAKDFRNTEMNRLIKSESPEKILNQMNSVSGIKRLEKVLSKSNEGKQLLNDLKRLKLDQMFENSMVNSAEKQLKFGTFANALDKPKNKEIIKELIGSKAFSQLQKLQKNVGRLADTYDKYYNASKSGVVATDAAVIGKMFFVDLPHLFYGNPFPFMKTAGGLMGAKKLSQLLADPEFLRLVEEAVEAADSGSVPRMNFAIENLRPYYQLVNQDHTSDEPVSGY